MKIKNDKLFIQIVCLIAAVGLWLVVMYIDNPVLEENYINVPVTIRNLSALENANLVMMNSDKEDLTVTVRASGLGDQLNNISSRDFSAYIDVISLREGVTTEKIEVIGPSGVEVVSVYPAQIAVNIEGIISKLMDVTVDFQGVHANNYYRDHARPNPSVIRIKGPRSIINSANLALASINIDEARDTVIRTVPVSIYDDKDTEIFLTSPTENVEVTVPIYPTKYVSLKPTVVGMPEEGFELVDVNVRPERVRIAGKQEVLDTIRDLSLEELDITDSMNNIIMSRNVIDTEGLIFLDLDATPVVSVTIEKVVEREFEFELDEIQFINQSEDTDIILEEMEEEEEKIIVTINATSTLANSLRKSDLILTVNLEEAVAGINTLELELVSEYTFSDVTFSMDRVDLEVIEIESEEDSEEE